MNTLLLCLNGVLIAGVYALARSTAESGLAPIALLAWQVVGAGAVLIAACLLRGERPVFAPRFLRYYLVAGLLGLTLPYLATYRALATMPAGVAGVIASLSPLFTYTMVCALGLEPPRAQRLGGLLLGAAGVFAIVLPREALPLGEIDAALLPALFAPLSLAAGNVYRSLAWPAGGRSLGMATGMLLVQAALVLPAALLGGALSPLQGAPAALHATLVGIALLSGLFYLGFFELQHRAGPVFVGQLGYVISLASLLLGVLLLAERPSAWVWGAALLIGAGVALIARDAAPPARTLATTGESAP